MNLFGCSYNFGGVTNFYFLHVTVSILRDYTYSVVVLQI